MPAFNLADLFVTLGLKSDGLKKGSAQAQSALSGIGKQAAATALGFIGAGGITQAIGGTTRAISGAVQNFAELETAMAEVSTLVDTSVVDMDRLRKGVVELSDRYGDTPQGLAGALYQAVSAGIDAKDALDFLDVAARAAIGGVTDTRTAVDALTSVLNAFGLETSDAEHASDILFQTIKAGKTTMAELAPAIGQVAPIAAAVGVSLEEMSAALATLTLSGLSTSEATTALRGLLNSLLKPTDDATKFSKQLGIEWGVDALEAKGLRGVLDDLVKTTGGSSKAMSILVPEIRGLNAALQLAGPAAEKFNDVLEDMAAAAGATDEAAAKMRDTLSFQWNLITQQIKNLGLAVTEDLVPALKDAVSTIGRVVQAMTFLARFDFFSKPIEGAIKLAQTINLVRNSSEEVNFIQSKLFKSFEDQIRLQAAVRKELGGLNLIYGENIALLKETNPEIAKRVEGLRKLEQQVAATIDGIVDGSAAEAAAADALVEAAKKVEEARKKAEEATKAAADAEADRFKDKKGMGDEEDKAAKQKLQNDLLRLDLAKKLAEAAHQFDMQEVNRRIEINEAIVQDDLKSYKQRELARLDLAKAKEEAAKKELSFQLEQNKRELVATKLKVENQKGVTDETLKEVEQLYDQASKNIEAKFGAEVKKETEAVIKIGAEIDRSMWQKLGDDVRKNFRSWADELQSGSSTAWAGLVDDSAEAIGTITDMFSAMPESVRGPLNDMSNLIVSALSGNPVQTAIAGLKLIGNAIFGVGDDSKEAAKQERIAAQEALSAAKAFLKSQDKVDLTLLSYDELNDQLSDLSDGFGEFAVSQKIIGEGADPQASLTAALKLQDFIADQGITLEKIQDLLRNVPVEDRTAADKALIAGLSQIGTKDVLGGALTTLFRAETGTEAGAEINKFLARARQITTTIGGVSTMTPAQALSAATTYRGADVAIGRMLVAGLISEDEVPLYRAGAAQKFKNQLSPAQFEQIMADAEVAANGPVALDELPQVIPTSAGGGAGAITVGPAFALRTPDQIISQRERSLDQQVRDTNNKFALGDISAQKYKDEMFRIANSYQGLAEEQGLSVTKSLVLRKKAIDLIEGSANVWQTAVMGGAPTTQTEGIDVSAPGIPGAPSPLGKQLGITLLPGFAVTEGGSVDFLDALSTLAQTISGAQPLLPDSMDININVVAGGPITDAQAQQISVGLGEAIITQMTTRGVVE